jgi:tetratricopeptide (TPR) repeat protein
MKQKVVMMALMCLVAVGGKAQTFGNDQVVVSPLGNLYDDATMEMALRAARETAPRRRQAYEFYRDQAYEAYRMDRWNDVINNVNNALNTGFHNGSLYFFRGFAYESLGHFKYAKKDYKMARKNGVYDANAALERVKQKMKAKRK